VNRTVAALLGAAASMGALPPFPIRNDRHRPESPETQARIQIAAVAKRARKRLVRIKGAELTALGQRCARAFSRCAVDYNDPPFRICTQEFLDADLALRARRAQS
jgi:hypothetical protein